MIPSFSREDQLTSINAELHEIRAQVESNHENLERIIATGSMQERLSALETYEAVQKRVEFLALTAQIIGKDDREDVTNQLWKLYDDAAVMLGEIRLMADEATARGHAAAAHALNDLLNGLRLIPQHMARDIEDL